MINWVPFNALLKSKASRCIYCGDPATVHEHLIPLSFLESRQRKSDGRYLRGESCADCNRLLGDRFFDTLDDRVRFVNQKLRAIDAKVRVAGWTGDELADMGHSMRSHIRNQQRVKAKASRRAAWVDSIDYVELREDLVRQCNDGWPNNDSLRNFISPGWSRHRA